MISKALIAGAYQRKAEELAARGVDLTVVVPPYWWDDAGRRTPLERRHTRGYRLVVEPMAFNGHFHLHWYPRLGRRFRQPYDLVHMDEEAYNLSTLQAMLLSRRAGARSLFFTWQNLRRRYPPPFSWIEQVNYRLAAGAIAGSGEAAQVLRRKGFAATRPVWVIPQFGIDPAVIHRQPGERPPGPDGAPPFTIGFVGRLVPQKGAHLLVEAAARLNGNIRLEFLAWGPEEGRIRALAARLGLESSLTVSPPLPSDEVPRFLSGLDVLVLPSLTTPAWKEQFGRVLVEAMACQVPVVGSTCGEIPHLIGDAGLIFPEGDVEALAASLRQLQESPPLRAALAARGYSRALAHYTQAQIAEQTVAAYRALLAGAAVRAASPQVPGE